MNKDILTVTPVAYMHTLFPEKFGIPRQASAADSEAEIVLEPEYRRDGILKDLETFSHLWLIWGFSANEGWSPTIRPPRLGGEVSVGVFASRSPYRPNPLGMSAVRILSVDHASWTIRVAGADMMDGTPVYDIKPYLPWCDSIPDASNGYASPADPLLSVSIPEDIQKKIPGQYRESLIRILSLDPRPAYHRDPERIYGLSYAGMNIRFTVSGHTLYVRDVQ